MSQRLGAIYRSEGPLQKSLPAEHTFAEAPMTTAMGMSLFYSKEKTSPLRLPDPAATLVPDRNPEQMTVSGLAKIVMVRSAPVVSCGCRPLTSQAAHSLLLEMRGV